MHILNAVSTCATHGAETTKMFWFYLLLGFLVTESFKPLVLHIYLVNTQ